MTIGERIRKIRKELDLTQAAFAARIGSVQNSVTGYENGRRNPSQPVISLICSEFNVNEDWLKTGVGEMFKPSPSSELDALAEKYDLSHGAYVLIEKFLNLKKDQQEAIINFVMEAAAGMAGVDPQVPAVPSGNVELDVEAEVEKYRQELLMQKKAEAESSASGGRGRGSGSAGATEKEA